MIFFIKFIFLLILKGKKRKKNCYMPYDEKHKQNYIFFAQGYTLQ